MTTENQSPGQPNPNGEPEQHALVNAIVDQIFGTIKEADEQAAAQRVANLRQRHPDATTDELAERLIRQRCMQAGMVGAVTSGASIIPGLGTVTTLVFGVAADLKMTYTIQSELVLELAALYGHPVGLEDKRYIVALVTGMSAGANQLVRRAGTELAEQATQRLARRAVAKSIPVVGVAASGGINMVSTYLIGRRAQAYFRHDRATLVALDDQLRALTGVDERKLLAWLSEASVHTWQLAGRQAQNLAGAVVVAGQRAGKLSLVVAGHAGNAAGGAWQRTKAGINTGAQTLSAWRKRRDKPMGDDPTFPTGQSDASPQA
jgi:hypothetical protein